MNCKAKIFYTVLIINTLRSITIPYNNIAIYLRCYQKTVKESGKGRARRQWKRPAEHCGLIVDSDVEELTTEKVTEQATEKVTEQAIEHDELGRA